MKSVVLIGMMGAGKTTALRLLAADAKLTGIDTDERIELSTGIQIPQIFATYGETYFRDLESQILMDCLGKYHVVASGGGIIKRPQNRQLLESQAYVIYLEASIPTLKKRLQNSDRPLLSKLEEIFHERKSIYASCANMTINTDHLKPEEVAIQIKEVMANGSSEKRSKSCR